MVIATAECVRPFDWADADEVRGLILDASLALTDVRAWANFNTTNDDGLAAANKLFEAVTKIQSIAKGAVDASP